MITEKILSMNSTSINYAEGPSNDIPLVLIHGFSGCWNRLLPMMPLLSLRYHIFAPDLRGHGKSSWFPGAYSIRDDVDDVTHLLHECVGAPTVILGHSHGGSVALLTAALVPDAVQAVVVIDPPLGFLIEGNTIAEGVTAFFRNLRDVLTGDYSDEERGIALSEILPAADPLTVRSRLQDLKRFDPERLTWAIDRRVAAGLQLDDFLPLISCPVLLIQCNPSLGGILDNQTTAAVTALLPDCVHHFRPESGHDINMDNLAEFAQMVTYFIESL